MYTPYTCQPQRGQLAARRLARVQLVRYAKVVDAVDAGRVHIRPGRVLDECRGTPSGERRWKRPLDSGLWPNDGPQTRVLVTIERDPHHAGRRHRETREAPGVPGRRQRLQRPGRRIRRGREPEVFVRLVVVRDLERTTSE